MHVSAARLIVVRLWVRFQNQALFSRLDSFLERCHDILELANTVLQFSKLETVEVGGTKGKVRNMGCETWTASQHDGPNHPGLW